MLAQSAFVVQPAGAASQKPGQGQVRHCARLQEQNPPRSGKEDRGELGGGAAETRTDAEAGMAEMSKRFHEEGGELYVPAAE